MVGSIVGLLGIGWKLFGLHSGSASNASPTISASTNATPTHSAAPSVTAPADQLSVQVLNGTQTAGLARKVSDTIYNEGWVIAAVSNWAGNPVKKNTVYYPEGYADQAAKLAELVNADTAPADATLPQNVLTLIVMSK
jgi:hypothetical protein